ncbi:hypothetical protein OH76DRAFT_243418 [Lentinus brumalis]|uniref:F-box domain-containing protein n=1 Tax=Lentinus brumalis TaxID=2498619 RepID=A0A371DHT1_9APHY|nr:hypothetical protein OH76DRAFT_243418 [Polyporus brumalis]
MVLNLPDELWLDIFEMAVEDADFFEPILPTTFSESAWFKNLLGVWTLRVPQEILNSAQRRSMFTKKAIMNTCRTWRRLGHEFYYRSIFCSNPWNVQRLCALMDRNSGLGQRTRRLHLHPYSTTKPWPALEVIQHSLVSIIRHCPRLEIFIINWPLSVSFSSVANALCTSVPHALRVLQINIPTHTLAKLIYMLQCLPNLRTAQIEFDGTPPEQIRLGAAGDLELTLSSLENLLLRGPFQDFIEQATAWHLPSLKLLSLDFITYREDFPDIVEFLTEHGSELTFLDLNCIPPLDIPTILDVCPMLTTFTFNPDWRIPGWENHPFLETFIVHQPHPNITTIGLHHLMYAFGVGYAATYNQVDPFVTHSIQRQNDVNFAAINKRNFPRLQRIRVLNTTLLTDLEKNNGPSQRCFERWERWSRQCQREGVRLEDCTGATLGTLPEDPEDEEDDDDGSSLTDEGSRHLTTLRELLVECRKMNALRELDVPSPALQMVYASTSHSS